MTPKEINALVMYVLDTAKSVAFYERLGFEVVRNEKGHGTVRLKEFELSFHDQQEEDKPEFRDDALAEPKGTGLYIYAEVGDVDAYFKTLMEKGVKTSSEPKDWPWGAREFALRDPDGYKLVFYTEKS